ncbi:hypothetical protein M0805_007921 [Coniferiporia weirii]|nr:hypothetical protein M0805_007921 [Coniferiporia weirii]
MAANTSVAAIPDNGQEEKKRRRRFAGFSEQVKLRRKQRARSNKPRPWIERKFVVAFVIGMAGYAWYVYIARFCLPMIRRDADAMGGRGMGVAFLVVFCLLGLMFWWSYLKLVLTPPGFARDSVEKSSAPQANAPRRRRRSAPTPSRFRDYDDSDSASDNWDSADDEIAGTPYAEISPPPSRSPTNEGPPQPLQAHFAKRDPERDAGTRVRATPPKPSAPNAARHTALPPRRMSSTSSRHRSSERGGRARRPSENQGSSAEPLAAGSSTGTTSADMYPFDNPKLTPLPPRAPPRPMTNQMDNAGRSSEGGHQSPVLARRPPAYPALLPEYRYCNRDGLVKPMRAHHCRVCGTCVLMYDHHCPWIGQCVGAHNQKFFVNFLQWSSPWTLWAFATLVGMNAKRDSDPLTKIDAQQIVIIALSGLFSLFTVVLLAAQIRLILINQSSVESLIISGMREREREIIGQLAPLCDWGTNVHKKRSAIRKQWNEEWGTLHTEGNIWWLGSPHANWEYRMGKNRWGWFLPVGRSEGDGLTYPVNPRFDAEGRWRRRSEWPPELR